MKVLSSACRRSKIHISKAANMLQQATQGKPSTGTLHSAAAGSESPSNPLPCWSQPCVWHRRYLHTQKEGHVAPNGVEDHEFPQLATLHGMGKVKGWQEQHQSRGRSEGGMGHHRMLFQTGHLWWLWHALHASVLLAAGHWSKVWHLLELKNTTVVFSTFQLTLTYICTSSGW